MWTEEGQSADCYSKCIQERPERLTSTIEETSAMNVFCWFHAGVSQNRQGPEVLTPGQNERGCMDMLTAPCRRLGRQPLITAEKLTWAGVSF